MNETTPERSIRDDFWRYAICGAVAVAVDYSIWWLLSVRAEWWTVAAQAISRPAGGLVSFAGNRLWTWRRRRAFSLGKQFARFWLVWAGLYVLAAAATWALSDVLPDEPRGRFLAKALADGATALIGFLFQRTLTFR